MEEPPSTLKHDISSSSAAAAAAGCRYKWYRRFEALHFPDPVGLRLVLQRWTLGLYPNGTIGGQLPQGVGLPYSLAY